MTNGNGIRHLTLGGHVGFDSLPDQLVNQAVTSGFTFNIMCVGETGLGKSTLMDSLFNTNFENQPQNHREPNVKLDSHTYELEESNVKLKLVRKEHSVKIREICSHFFCFRLFVTLLDMVIKSINRIVSLLSLSILMPSSKHIFKKN